ncbi:hypothetical protein Glove_117g125 [Diversispora epigaea]|uniref:Protein kinase domain-containing protein n=1 Tax=Diversispora epigaea TaxID=1348612 RepID=A0A397J4U4_9GLOM|nr:hypothetical protein Glove_117g125 [Diversispora epigaea]
MKETRKTEEMKEIGETKELEESEESENNLGKCSKCHQYYTGGNWCHSCKAKQFQNEFDKWTSGDKEIDKFIQQMQLDANKLLNGFHSTDLKMNGKQGVYLKSLDNSTNKNDFLQEIKNQLKFRGKYSIAMYGITKNPTENEYMMVMNYGLMHKDFHPGNIVNQRIVSCYITDFGLCKPVSEKIFGIIPYMAPETLSRGEYTQASEIYSFGMVIEVLTSYPPYYNISHDENLAIDICEGLKPEIKCEIPQFFKDIMEKCWNFESFNRPTAEELKFQLLKFSYNSYKDDEIRKQIKAANKSNKNLFNMIKM